MSKNRSANSDICTVCSRPCCNYVKHMPFSGEGFPECYRNFIIGSFPVLKEEAGELGQDDKFFETEWIVPAEIDSCIAYSRDGLCKIYEQRPIACRNFPLIGPDRVHPFCKAGKKFLANTFIVSNFPWVILPLERKLLEIYTKDGAEGLKYIILEENPLSPPLIYNSYLALCLKASCVNVQDALDGQKRLLEHFWDQGLTEITAIVPGTEFCISGRLEGLMANLEYLSYRLKHGLDDQLSQFIVEVSGTA